MNQALFVRVRDFVAAERGVTATRVTPQSTLFGDLGLDGDDAYEFFVAFKEQFDVDLKDLDLDRHFGPEGMYPWTPLYWIILALRSGTPEVKARKEPITVADLVNAAAAGYWKATTSRPPRDF